MRTINEINSQDILQSADAARKVRGNRTQAWYAGVSFRTARQRRLLLLFRARDPGGSGRVWEPVIVLPSYKEVSRDKSIDYEEKLLLAFKAGDVRVYCPCPDFLYKGFKYMAWQMEYGTERETRFPKVRNPKLEGSVCKHCLSMLAKLDLVIPTIAGDLAKGKSTNYRNILRLDGL